MTLDNFINVIEVILGVGLVIFVHELGHYLAARWAGARVEVFSIGMGPKLFGWRRGDTLFQVAALPLGGYVKIAGEYPAEGGEAARAGDLGSMSVWHRFVYYSGGVIMNLLFAMVVLPLVLFAGLPVTEPIFGEPAKGTPAWHARIESGSRVLSINGREPLDFGGIRTEVALSGRKPVDLRLLTPAGQETNQSIASEFDENMGLYRLGVRAAYDADRILVVVPGGAAEVAGLTNDDRLLAVEGQPGSMGAVFQLQRALAIGGSMTLRVVDEAGFERGVEIVPKSITNEGQHILGIAPQGNRVMDLRTGPGGQDGPAQRLDLQKDDRILSVAGQTIWRTEDLLRILLEVEGPVEMQVRRHDQTLALAGPAMDESEKVALMSDLLFIRDVESPIIVAEPGLAAAQAGVRDGDRVVAVDGEPTEGWEDVFELVQARTKRHEPVVLTVTRGSGEASERHDLHIVPAAVSGEDYGFGLKIAAGIHKASGVGDAIRTGTLASWRFLVDTWQTLKKMVLSDEVSSKNLGGIITISVISFETASQGWAKLFFFLSILSVNLALLNVLPIPILDGGHLMFLLVEAVKGSPVSERTLGYSQVVGLVMLLSLMIYVTYQDVLRWIIGP